MLNHVGLEKKVGQTVQGGGQCDVEEAQSNARKASRRQRGKRCGSCRYERFRKAAQVDARHQEDRQRSGRAQKATNYLQGRIFLHGFIRFQYGSVARGGAYSGAESAEGRLIFRVKRMQEGDQRSDFVWAEVSAEGGHVPIALKNLADQLVVVQPSGDATEIRASLPTLPRDGMAVSTLLSLNDGRAHMFKR